MQAQCQVLGCICLLLFDVVEHVLELAVHRGLFSAAGGGGGGGGGVIVSGGETKIVKQCKRLT